MVRCFLPPRLGLRVFPVQALEDLACGDGGGFATSPRPDLCFAGRYAPRLSRVAEGPSGRLGRYRHALWPVAIGQRPLSCFNRTNDSRADTRGTQRKTLGAWPKYNENAARSPAEQGDGTTKSLDASPRTSPSTPCRRAAPIAAICLQAAGRGAPPTRNAPPATLPRHCRRGMLNTTRWDVVSMAAVCTSVIIL